MNESFDAGLVVIREVDLAVFGFLQKASTSGYLFAMDNHSNLDLAFHGFSKDRRVTSEHEPVHFVFATVANDGEVAERLICYRATSQVSEDNRESS